MFKNNEIKSAALLQQQSTAGSQQLTLGRQPKTTPITDDFEISNTVLGLGINGKVVQCTNRLTGKKYALKVSTYCVCCNKCTQKTYSLC